jgi:hypothetical protein
MAVDYAALVKTILDGGGRSFGVEDLLAVRRAIIDDYAGPDGPLALARIDDMLKAHGWKFDD